MLSSMRRRGEMSHCHCVAASTSVLGGSRWGTGGGRGRRGQGAPSQISAFLAMADLVAPAAMGWRTTLSAAVPHHRPPQLAHGVQALLSLPCSLPAPPPSYYRCVVESREGGGRRKREEERRGCGGGGDFFQALLGFGGCRNARRARRRRALDEEESTRLQIGRAHV